MKQRYDLLDLMERALMFVMALTVVVGSLMTLNVDAIDSAPEQSCQMADKQIESMTKENSAYVSIQVKDITFTEEHEQEDSDSYNKLDRIRIMIKKRLVIPDTIRWMQEQTLQKEDISTEDKQTKTAEPMEEIEQTAQIEQEEMEQTEQTEESDLLLSKIDKNSTTEERILALFEFFMSEGFSAEASAGIIGNIAVESKFDPTAVSSDDCYHGLCQWNTTDGGGHWWDGKNGILKWLEANEYSWDSFEGQARAILYCERKGYLTGENLEKFKAMDSVEEAAEFFCRKYEVGVGIENRKSEAKFVYELYLNPEGEYTGNKPYTCPA